MSVKVVLPFVNCTSVWEVWSASTNVKTTPLALGVIFLSVAVSFTSWAVPDGVNAPLSLNLICILETSTSNCGESTFAVPDTPAVIAVLKLPTSFTAALSEVLLDILLWRIQ